MSGDDHKALVPDGKYQVQCISYDKKFIMGKARKLFLHFEIIKGKPNEIGWRTT